MAVRRSVFIAGFVAVAIAAVATYLLYNYMKGQERVTKELVATEKVVVAAREIPAGTNIDAGMVKVVDWPRANVPPGAILSTEQVVGRVTIEKHLAGDPIVEARLVPKEGSPGVLTYRIPEGHRAMTVGVDQVAGVAGFITPGSMVDVVLTITPPGGQQPISKVIPSLQNIPVLAIGQIVEQKEGQPVVVPTVTMDVSPQQAEELAIASTQGRLQLVLRRAGDKEMVKTHGANVTKVISGIQPSVPKIAKAVKKPMAEKVEEKPAPPPPPPPHVVEVIKGTSRTTEQFKAQ